MKHALALTCTAVVLSACASPSLMAPSFAIQGNAPAAALSQIEADTRRGRAAIETFFGRPFREPLRVIVAGDRATFNASFPEAWGMSTTECWMVGVGAADFLAVLSPRAWASEACEHDPADATHLQQIVTHELTHAFHAQYNPTRDFTGMDEMAWFVEGLAVVVSGQLNAREGATASDAIAADAAPSTLAEAWSGQYRYGVSGSLVQYIDETYGRSAIADLLSATSNAQALDRLGVSESQLLSDWRRWVQRQERPSALTSTAPTSS